jgi:TMEM175 potassium channel family protein
MSDRWETGRLEAFSDGVLAIAITLLVLELSVPEADFEHLWRGIADQWPSYLAYVTSFTTIGAIWLVHHGMFRRLASADGVVTRLNLLLLMLALFLPFPTKLVAEAVDSGNGERPAVMFYGLVLLSVSIVVTVMWRHIAGHSELLNADVSDAEVDAVTRRRRPTSASTQQ